MAEGVVAEIRPKPRVYVEKIGAKEWELTETKLDVEKDVVLWSSNPRLETTQMAGVASEADLEAALQRTPGYEPLRRSIYDLGQMEPIYAWKPEGSPKYVVLEGATRVSILRELNRKYPTGPREGKYRWVRAKILPPDFGDLERAILLARIHVRGSGVRAWGRYIEAKFIYETVEEKDGRPPLMNATEMAIYMQKSVSWVTRLRDAYKFAMKFVEHVDNDDAGQLAAREFSTLEEISKAPTIGAQLREYDNPKYDQLRNEVFDMVSNEVFKEYRDARFLKDFYDDPEKWSQLKSGEKHVAARLAMEVKTNSSSIKAKIAQIEQQVQRAIDRDQIEFADDDIEALQRVILQINNQVHPGVRPFRVALKSATRALGECSLVDVKDLTLDEIDAFREAAEYFEELVAKHAKAPMQ